MKFFITTLIILASIPIHAQSSGYLGKRTFVEADGLINMPLFSMLFNREKDYYKKFGANSLTQSNNYMDFGWRVGLIRVSRNNVGVGLEFGHDYQNLTFPEYENRISVTDTNTGWVQTVEFNHEMLDLSSVNIMPKLLFTNKGGLVPVGFTHEIGLGYSSTKVVQKDYVFVATQNASLLNDSAKAEIRNNYVDYNYRFGGITFLYGMKMSMPVSKRVLINYGLRYTLHLRNILMDSSSSSNKIIPSSYLRSGIGRERTYNFISLNIGVAFAL